MLLWNVNSTYTVYYTLRCTYMKLNCCEEEHAWVWKCRRDPMCFVISFFKLHQVEDQSNEMQYNFEYIWNAMKCNIIPCTFEMRWNAALLMLGGQVTEAAWVNHFIWLRSATCTSHWQFYNAIFCNIGRWGKLRSSLSENHQMAQCTLWWCKVPMKTTLQPSQDGSPVV